MTVLLVEDEEGIREGLATFLGLRGQVVRTAGDVPEARRLLDGERFTCLVTDWRLGGVTAAALLDAAADLPCVVVSGSPQDVDDDPRIAAVLDKPVAPDRLVAAIEAAIAARATSSAPPPPELPAAAPLPADTATILAAAAALLGGGVPAGIVADDGVLVTWEARPPAPPDAPTAAALQRLGGDLRVADDGRVTLRIYRDARPDGVTAVVRPDAADWPAEPLAIDLDGCDLDVAGLVALLARSAGRGPGGGPSPLLNVPAALRWSMEALGWAGRMPMRDAAGPRIPEALARLWR